MFSCAWAFLLPTDDLEFQPDETSHFATIRFMATHPGGLPPYTMEYNTSYHPPVYHGTAALLYAWASPPLGDRGAVLIVRLFSVLLGAGTIYFTYHLARQSRLCRPVAVPVAALVAFVPMRLSLGGAATNENLATLGATASLFFLFAAVRMGFTTRRLLFLSFWIAVAVGSKITCAGLIPAIAVAVLLRRKPGNSFGRSAAFVAVPVAAVAVTVGWWFVYNTLRFGDPLRMAAADRMSGDLMPGFEQISARTGMPAWRYLVSILVGGWISFWGQFDAMRERLPYAIYALLFFGNVVSIWGFLAALPRSRPPSREQIAMLVSAAVFAAWVLLIYIQFNWQYYTPQGRYFFGLLGPIALALVGGMLLFLRRYVSDRATRWIAGITAGAFLFAVNVYCLLVFAVLPFYARRG